MDNSDISLFYVGYYPKFSGQYYFLVSHSQHPIVYFNLFLPLLAEYVSSSLRVGRCLHQLYMFTILRDHKTVFKRQTDPNT